MNTPQQPSPDFSSNKTTTQVLKKNLFLFAFVTLASCKNAENKISNKASKSTITINLPFESSNYDDATNFSLHDSSGKTCIPELDTVTKGGGTIIYKDLPNGTYYYLIRTIFGEEIKNTLKIDSSRRIDFYDECYDIKDVISFDSLTQAQKIDLVIKTMNDTESSKSDVFKIEKKEHHYSLKYINKDVNKYLILSRIDSTKLINALAEFETTITGLREMKITEGNYSYIGSNSVSLKCNNSFLQIWDLKLNYLNKAFEKFKQAVIY